MNVQSSTIGPGLYSPPATLVAWSVSPIADRHWDAALEMIAIWRSSGLQPGEVLQELLGFRVSSPSWARVYRETARASAAMAEKQGIQ